MNRSRLRKLVVCSLVGAGLSAPALAILGVGDIVFDPTNYGEALRQLVQLEQQYEQLVRTYHMVRSQYEHMQRMAQQVPVDRIGRYKALATPWRNSSSADLYGTAAGWIAGINTGAAVASGYARATERLAPYGASFSKIPADHLSRVKTSYATVELTDGSNQHAMETVGRLRANANAVERAIQGLEDDSLSPDPAMNTEIAVLNKINASTVIHLRGVQDTNKLLVALAEAQVVAAKRTRDVEAQAINNHIRFLAEGKAAIEAQTAGASAAMMAWRMP